MVTKELLKIGIDKVQDEYLDVLYKIIKIFEVPAGRQEADTKIIASVARKDDESEWHDFIAETYGCFADDPIQRVDQGMYEVREAI